MREIIALLACLESHLSRPLLKQLSHLVWAMLCIPNRVTMLGLARWTEKGGSYRSLQRLYQSPIDWLQVHWLLLKSWLPQEEGKKLLLADEVVIEKVGKKTYGIGQFYSSKAQRSVSSLSFLAFSLLNVATKEAYPLQIVQEMPNPSPPPKVEVQAAKRPRGRPKGSKNRKKTAPVLSPHLQGLLNNLLLQKENLAEMGVKHLVMDGKYGNYPSIWAVRQSGLHLISKMRHDAALYLGKGQRLNLAALPADYRVQTSIEGDYQLEIYQVQAFTKECPEPLNCVICCKIHSKSGKVSRLIIFSTDLTLSALEILEYYSLRFQIEFNFRDAKQYWGLDDFMNVSPQAVTNAANFAFLMVQLSQRLLKPYQQVEAQFSVLDLKALCRAQRYLSETLKMLPDLPEPNLIARIRQRLFRLGSIRTRYSDKLAA
jgi:hypothetical protein